MERSRRVDLSECEPMRTCETDSRGASNWVLGALREGLRIWLAEARTHAWSERCRCCAPGATPTREPHPSRATLPARGRTREVVSTLKCMLRFAERGVLRTGKSEAAVEVKAALLLATHRKIVGKQHQLSGG
jgi:hypothetical protein